jgi:L-lactate dehydrogenase (cytochrome)
MAAKKMGTMFGISTMATTSIEEIGELTNGPKLFQLYIHKDRGLTDNLIERCRKAGFNSICLTVDTVVAGNRERDHRTGFTTPPRLTFGSLLSFALHPGWTLNHFFREKFKLANIIHSTEKGSSIDRSVIEYINEQFDPSMSWKDAEYCVKKWKGPFALKGVMSVEDAKKAIDIGCTAIMISNHGGRQLDGSRAPFDQLMEIVDAVGDKIEVILDGGIRRGTHVLKALALGAKACSFGKGYLFALGAGGQEGVESILKKMKEEIKRDMILMGCKSVKELDKSKVSFR